MLTHMVDKKLTKKQVLQAQTKLSTLLPRCSEVEVSIFTITGVLSWCTIVTLTWVNGTYTELEYRKSRFDVVGEMETNGEGVDIDTLVIIHNVMQSILI